MWILADNAPPPSGPAAGTIWLVIAIAVIAVAALTIESIIRHNRRSDRKR